MSPRAPKPTLTMRSHTRARAIAAGILIAGLIALIVFVAAAVLLGLATPAGATGRGHTPVTVCHHGQTITVDDSAAPAHQRHGDTLGACDTTPEEEPCETPDPTSPGTGAETPAPKPSATPTPSPEPTTSATPEPQPTSAPSPNSTPTPTVEPEPTPSPTSTAPTSPSPSTPPTPTPAPDPTPTSTPSAQPSEATPTPAPTTDTSTPAPTERPEYWYGDDTPPAEWQMQWPTEPEPTTETVTEVLAVDPNPGQQPSTQVLADGTGQLAQTGAGDAVSIAFLAGVGVLFGGLFIAAERQARRRAGGKR